MTFDIGLIDLGFVGFLAIVALMIRRAIRNMALPLDMVLHCPACGHQHVDAPARADPSLADSKPWTNPPHRTHLCGFCGYRWRPADVPTNGVRTIKTEGKHDSPPVEIDWTNE